MTVFLAVGLLFYFTSNFVGNFLLKNYVSFARIQAVILVIAGLLMIKSPSFLNKIQLPKRFERLLYDNPTENIYKFSFFMGVAYTIIATPCASGIFILVWSNLFTFNIVEGSIMMLFFTIGAGLPFIIMSLYIPRIQSDFLNTIQNARKIISIILGVLLIIVGIWLFTTETSTYLISQV